MTGEQAVKNHNRSSAAGITLGKTCPKPVVDYSKVREGALAAFAATRRE